MVSDARVLNLPDQAFDKEDDGSDLDFYAPPRFVTHIDEGALAALTNYYALQLNDGARVLDLMSSWVSHLPDDLDLDVVGHGMNAEELAANPRLARWFVHDLNRDPILPEPDGEFDAVLICAGVQYMQQPLAVFREVRRVLKPGGVVIASFANRCFPTKAVAIWRALDMEAQAALIRLYLDTVGFDDVAATLLADGKVSDPLVAVTGRI